MKSSNGNLIARLQRWMDSIPGQTFLNYAYSWGASVVILGALFKLTHLPLANLMLYLGMGTEVFVFFLSGFDLPFDAKQAEKKDLAEADALVDEEATDDAEAPAATTTIVGGGIGGNIIIGGGSGAPVNMEGQEIPAGTEQGGAVIAGGVIGGGLIGAAPVMSTVNDEMKAASEEYIEKLKVLTETLQKVEAQCARLTTDSEEMTNLNRTLTGINTIYELQLKSVSQQVGSIDQVNEQTRKMAQQIEELNAIYARMIQAMTVNMKNVPTQEA